MEKPEMTDELFRKILRKELIWLKGFASCLGNVPLISTVDNLSALLNRHEEYIGVKQPRAKKE